MNNGDMAAGPVLHSIDGNWVREPLDEYKGLTKREHFAAMAMQGLLANGEAELYMKGLSQESIDNLDYHPEQYISLACVSYANGLLKALEETK